MGEAYTRLGEHNKARKYWQEYVNAYPNDIESLLALINLAHEYKDEPLLCHTAIRLLSLKSNKTWDEFFEEFLAGYKKNILFFLTDPWELLSAIRDGLEKEMNYISFRRKDHVISIYQPDSRVFNSSSGAANYL